MSFPNTIQQTSPVLCYICGKEQTTTSITLHIMSCLSRFDQDSLKQPEKTSKSNYPTTIIHQGLLPYQKIIDSNEFTLINIILTKCNICGKNFNHESFLVHQRLCRGGDPIKPFTANLPIQNLQNKEEVQQSLKRPKTLMCNRCGSEYIIGSLTIHMKQCKQQQNPTEDFYDSLVAPSTPKVNQSILNQMKSNAKNAVEVSNHHEESFNQKDESEEYPLSEQRLEKCTKCERKFVIDRIEKHQFVCKGTKREVDIVFKNEINSQISIKQVKRVEVSQRNSIVQDSIHLKCIIHLKCYGCYGDFTIECINKHVTQCQKCKYKNLPPLLNDIFQIAEPSRYLIDFYNWSLLSQEEQSNSLTKQNTKKKQISQPSINHKSQDVPMRVPNSDKKSSNKLKVDCPDCLQSFEQSTVKKHKQTCRIVTNKSQNLKQITKTLINIYDTKFKDDYCITPKKGTNQKGSLERSQTKTTVRDHSLTLNLRVGEKVKSQIIQDKKEISKQLNNFHLSTNSISSKIVQIQPSRDFIRQNKNQQRGVFHSTINPLFVVTISSLADRRREHQLRKVSNHNKANLSQSPEKNKLRKQW